MRLIDADALMKDLEKWMKQVDPTHPQEDNAIPPMENIIVSTLMTIEEQPTIEERKQGEWIYIERKRLTDLGYITEKYWMCSACGNAKGFRTTKPLDNFCLVCGADMRGKNHVAD